jgi:hypothetical protein
MATTLISVYDHLSAADQARDELLASGFAADCVHLVAQENEAGPVKGNFTVGDAGRDRDKKRGLFGAGNNDEVYARDYANPQYRAEIMLTVDAEDEQQSRMAADIMHRYGAVRVDRGASGAHA